MSLPRTPPPSEVDRRASLLTDGAITDATRDAARRQLAVEPGPAADPLPDPVRRQLRRLVVARPLVSLRNDLFNAAARLEAIEQAHARGSLRSRIEAIRERLALAMFDAETLLADVEDGDCDEQIAGDA